MRARYYKPNIKRFINQDVVQGSLEDARSLNRFAYTNGINPFGTDVIWITSDSTRIGHTSLVVQNDKGDWYYFFYGVNDVSLKFVSDLDMRSLEEFNDWTSELKKNYYTSSTYIPCDSKEIYNECIKLVDNYDNRKDEGNWFYKLIAGNDCNPDYDAVTNNCSTACWNVVMKGKLSNGSTIREYMDNQFITMRTTDSPDLSCAKVSSGKPYVTQSYIEMMFENKAFILKTYKKQINDKLKNAQKKGYTITYNGKIGMDMKKLAKIDKSLTWVSKIWNKYE